MGDGLIYEVQPTPGATFDGMRYQKTCRLVQVDGPVEVESAPSEMISDVSDTIDPIAPLRAALADEDAKVRIYPPGAVAALLEQRDAFWEALTMIASDHPSISADYEYAMNRMRGRAKRALDVTPDPKPLVEVLAEVCPFCDHPHHPDEPHHA